VGVVVVDVDLNDVGISEPWVTGMGTRVQDLSPAAAAWAREVMAGYAQEVVADIDARWEDVLPEHDGYIS
jgi:hypothetical protein